MFCLDSINRFGKTFKLSYKDKDIVYFTNYSKVNKASNQNKQSIH